MYSLPTFDPFKNSMEGVANIFIGMVNNIKDEKK
jgi:hypothetical protein